MTETDRNKYKVYLYLTYVCEADPSALFARQFILSEWYKDDNQKTEKKRFYLLMWTKTPSFLERLTYFF